VAFFDPSRRGWVFIGHHDEPGRDAFNNGAWNSYRFELLKHHPYLGNGVQVANLVDDMTSEGFVAFSNS